MIMYAQEQSQFVYFICISLGFYGLMLEIAAAFGHAKLIISEQNNFGE